MLADGIAWVGALMAAAMCFAIGSNDVCQSLAVGSGAVTVTRALVLGAVAEFLGVVLMGGAVAESVKEGFVDLSVYAETPVLLSLGMFAVLSAAATWLLVSTWGQLPVSTTHSVVGGLLGFAWVTTGTSAIRTEFFTGVAASWVLSPALGAGASWLVLTLVNSAVFTPLRGSALRARQYLPYINGATATIMALFLAFKGLPNAGIAVSNEAALAGSGAIGVLVWGASLAGLLPAGRTKRTHVPLEGSAMGEAEEAFVPLLVVTALLVAFAHGSNDVSNGVGCLLVMREVAAFGRVLTANDTADAAPIPPWIMVMGGLSISIGLLALGARVMSTMGSKITTLTPSRGFCAQLATSSTVLLATGLGLPISSTHTMVGAVTGLALASTGKAAAINYATIRKIVISWVITLPIGALTAVVYFYILSAALYSPDTEAAARAAHTAQSL